LDFTSVPERYNPGNQVWRLAEVDMTWTADILTEPSRDHELCVDLYDDDVVRGRIRRNERFEVELICYGGEFAIPADWLVGIIQRFTEETGLLRDRRS
jgi:hypothetical protein